MVKTLEKRNTLTILILVSIPSYNNYDESLPTILVKEIPSESNFRKLTRDKP